MIALPYVAAAEQLEGSLLNPEIRTPGQRLPNASMQQGARQQSRLNARGLPQAGRVQDSASLNTLPS